MPQRLWWVIKSIHRQWLLRDRLSYGLIHHFDQFDYVWMVWYFLQDLPLPHEELARCYFKSPYSQRIILRKDLAVALMSVLGLLPQNLVLFGVLRLLEHLLRGVELLFTSSLLALTPVSLYDFVDCSILPCAHLNDDLVLLLKRSQLGCALNREVLEKSIVRTMLENRLGQCGYKVCIILLLIPRRSCLLLDNG